MYKILIAKQLDKIQHDLNFGNLNPTEITLANIRKELLIELRNAPAPANPFQAVIELLPYNMGKAVEAVYVANYTNNSNCIDEARDYIARAIKVFEDIDNYDSATIAKLNRLFSKVEYNYKDNGTRLLAFQAIERIIEFRCETVLAMLESHLKGD